MYCLPGVSTCVECIDDSQCGPGRICDSTHNCRAGCSGTSPACAGGEVCDVDAGTCVGCLSNANCTQPPVCNPATKSCVGCLTGTDCHGSTLVCDPQTMTCVQCDADNDCGAGKLCQNHACVPGCSQSHSACPNNQVCDTASGKCVACVDDSQCSGSTPRCNTTAHTCVACLPGANDNCPQGEYCRPDFVCERGCKADAECPGGMCVNHSCTGCLMDSQCAAGLICQGGSCIASCSAQNPCGSGNECCTQRCVNEQTDVNNCGSCGHTCGSGESCCGGQCTTLTTQANCGACGTACGAGSACCGGSCQSTTTLQQCGACGVACGTDQFCDGTQCQNVVFPNFCANKNVYAIYDGISLDNGATNVLASTIVANCSAQTAVQYGPQTNPAWVDQDAGTLLLGSGSTVVTAGGPFADKPVKWMERTSKTTKVYFATNGIDTFYFKRRSDDAVLVTQPAASCDAHHDVLLVELAADPASGTLALIAYGVCSGGYGTQAAGWYYANVMLPNRMSYPDSWYLFQWDDTNGDSLPDVNDSWTKLASGQ
jgi:Cys-rich repeat protein